MVGCGLALGLFFFAGMGAGALGCAGVRLLQEEGVVDELRGRMMAVWHRRGGAGCRQREGRGRAGPQRYRPLPDRTGWGVASTHSSGVSTPMITVESSPELTSPTSSEDGWLQL